MSEFSIRGGGGVEIYRFFFRDGNWTCVVIKRVWWLEVWFFWMKWWLVVFGVVDVLWSMWINEVRMWMNEVCMWMNEVRMWIIRASNLAFLSWEKKRFVQFVKKTPFGRRKWLDLVFVLRVAKREKKRGRFAVRRRRRRRRRRRNKLHVKSWSRKIFFRSERPSTVLV